MNEPENVKKDPTWKDQYLQLIKKLSADMKEFRFHQDWMDASCNLSRRGIKLPENEG